MVVLRTPGFCVAGAAWVSLLWLKREKGECKKIEAWWNPVETMAALSGGVQRN